jgi:hypothetical protein
MLEMSGNSGVAEVSDEDLLLRLSLLMIDELLLRLRIAFKRSAIAHSLRRPPLASMSHSPCLLWKHCSWSWTSLAHAN